MVSSVHSRFLMLGLARSGGPWLHRRLAFRQSSLRPNQKAFPFLSRIPRAMALPMLLRAVMLLFCARLRGGGVLISSDWWKHPQ